MGQRVILLLASLSSAAILFVAFFVQGSPTSGPVPLPPASAAIEIPDVAVVLPTPEVTTQIDNVYVQPAATPKTIRIEQTAPPPTSAAARTTAAAATNAAAPTLAPRVRRPAREPEAERSGGGEGD